MKPVYAIFKRLVAQPLGQAADPMNIEEAQRGMVSTIDTIDLDDDEVIDVRGSIRTFADSGKPIYVGIYTSFRHDGPRLRQRRLPDPQRQLHRHARAPPRRRARPASDVALPSSRYPAATYDSVDSERDALTVLKLLYFEEQIYVYVAEAARLQDRAQFLPSPASVSSRSTTRSPGELSRAVRRWWTRPIGGLILVLALLLIAPATASARPVEDAFFNSVISSRVDHLIGFTPTTFAIHPSGEQVVPIEVRVGGHTYRFVFGNAAAMVGPSPDLRRMIRMRRYPSPEGVFLDRRLTARDRRYLHVRADLGRDADVLVVARAHPACGSGVSRSAVRGIAAGTIRTWSAAGVPVPASGDAVSLRRAGTGSIGRWSRASAPAGGWRRERGPRGTGASRRRHRGTCRSPR